MHPSNIKMTEKCFNIQREYCLLITTQNYINNLDHSIKNNKLLYSIKCNNLRSMLISQISPKRWVQIMELFIMQFSPPSCQFIPLRFRYSHLHYGLYVFSKWGPTSRSQKIVSFIQILKIFVWEWKLLSCKSLI